VEGASSISPQSYRIRLKTARSGGGSSPAAARSSPLARAPALFARMAFCGNIGALIPPHR